MKTEDIVREVLDEYIGSQINIDSEVARKLLAKHIAEKIDISSTHSCYEQSEPGIDY